VEGNAWLKKCENATALALGRLAMAVRGDHADDKLVDEEGMEYLKRLCP
jgi:hypothetical protein